MVQEQGDLVLVAFQDMQWKCRVVWRILIAKPKGSLWALLVRKEEGRDKGYEFYVTQDCIQKVLTESEKPRLSDPDLQAKLDQWRKEQGGSE